MALFCDKKLKTFLGKGASNTAPDPPMHFLGFCFCFGLWFNCSWPLPWATSSLNQMCYPNVWSDSPSHTDFELGLLLSAWLVYGVMVHDGPVPQPANQPEVSRIQIGYRMNKLFSLTLHRPRGIRRNVWANQAACWTRNFLALRQLLWFLFCRCLIFLRKRKSEYIKLYPKSCVFIHYQLCHLAYAINACHVKQLKPLYITWLLRDGLAIRKQPLTFDIPFICFQYSIFNSKFNSISFNICKQHYFHILSILAAVASKEVLHHIKWYADQCLAWSAHHWCGGESLHSNCISLHVHQNTYVCERDNSPIDYNRTHGIICWDIQLVRILTNFKVI